MIQKVFISFLNTIKYKLNIYFYSIFIYDVNVSQKQQCLIHLQIHLLLYTTLEQWSCC